MHTKFWVNALKLFQLLQLDEFLHIFQESTQFKLVKWDHLISWPSWHILCAFVMSFYPRLVTLIPSCVLVCFNKLEKLICYWTWTVREKLHFFKEGPYLELHICKFSDSKISAKRLKYLQFRQKNHPKRWSEGSEKSCPIDRCETQRLILNFRGGLEDLQFQHKNHPKM